MNAKPETRHRAVDLNNCAREPIHIPGSIQPHGFLLALEEIGFTVRHASGNCSDYFGKSPGNLVGQPLNTIVPQQVASVLREKMTEPRLQNVNPIKLQLGDKGQEQVFDAIAHRSQGLLVLEFEPSRDAEDPSFSGIYRRINAAVEAIEDAPTLVHLYQTTAEQVKRLSGYQRVMIYEFDAEWNGKVIAEARDPDQEPFLGLQYPASDIPAQARELYRRNWLRMIPDVHYEPVPIYPAHLEESQEALDLSNCVLRSVSPMHIQYLKNMGVGASMSVSIIREGELWGLIALHHDQAAYLPYEVRQGLEFVGKLFSVQLVAKEKHENLGYKTYLKSLQPQLLEKMRNESTFLEGLHRHKPQFLNLAKGVTGGAIMHQGKVTLIGDTPSGEQVKHLAQWLDQTMAGRQLFHTTSLAEQYGAASAFKSVASGLLAIAIPELEPTYILWFKPEVIQTVNWGGNPEKPVEITSDGAGLSPRRSFALWQETVHQQSLPWAREEIEAVEELRRSVIEVHLERQIRSAMESNQELDQFASVISHDLKEPLRGIGFFAGFLEEDLKNRLDAESAGNLAEIQQLVFKAQQLISELYEYSKVGRMELAFTDVDLNDVVNDAFLRLKPFFQENGAELLVPPSLPTVFCDRVRINEVFYNLLANAVKYNEQADKRVEVGAEITDGAPIFYVRDNGIGIAEEARQRIFRMFQRLHSPEDFGGGTGVGLAIVKRIIDRHGGRIWVESEPGQGSTFRFTLRPQ